MPNKFVVSHCWLLVIVALNQNMKARKTMCQAFDTVRVFWAVCVVLNVFHILNHVCYMYIHHMLERIKSVFVKLCRAYPKTVSHPHLHPSHRIVTHHACVKMP